MTVPRALSRKASICLLLPIFAVPACAKTSPAADPQIVQISFMQGDVRITRAKSGYPNLNGAWLTAVAGLNIRSGDTLSTGAGRAEIELETGSTLYLGENSVAEFNSLVVDASGAAHSELTLLSGTLSAYFQPASGEVLTVQSPTGIAGSFDTKAFVRFDSYLDGLEITALDPAGQAIPPASGAPIQLKLGQTLSIFEDLSYRVSDFSNSTTPADWNQWVLDRVVARDVSLQAAFGASHLSSYVPGLVALFEAGKFFDCGAPSSCWEPNDATDPPDAEGASPSKPATTPGNLDAFSRVAYHPVPALSGAFSLRFHQGAAPPAQAPGQAPGGQPGSTLPATPGQRYTEYTIQLDCSQRQATYVIDEVTKKRYLIGITPVYAPWTRSTCHSGAYIYYHRHFVFVVGTKHRDRPFHWVRAGKNYGYVLRSPLDAKGKPLANLQHGVYMQNSKAGFHLASVSSNEKVETLSSIPKPFAAYTMQKLAASAQPEIEAHSIEIAEAARTGSGQTSSGPIRYDFQKHEFVQQASGASEKEVRPIVVGRVDSRGVFSGQRNPLISAFDHKEATTTYAQQTAASGGHVESTGTFAIDRKSPHSTVAVNHGGISRGSAGSGGSSRGSGSSGGSYRAGGSSGSHTSGGGGGHSSGGGSHGGGGGGSHGGGGGGSRGGGSHPGRG